MSCFVLCYIAELRWGLIQYLFNCHMSHHTPKLFEFKKKKDLSLLYVCTRRYVASVAAAALAVAEAVFLFQSVLQLFLLKERALTGRNF